MYRSLFQSAVALLLVCLPLTAPAQTISQDDRQPECADGKARLLAGVREAITAQTANQADYDVVFYDLDISVDPVGETVSGAVTMRGVVLSTALQQVDINLENNMTVTQVEDAAVPLAFTHASDMITATLARTYLQGETFSLTVHYSGTPIEYGFGAFRFDVFPEPPDPDAAPMIWSLSEPFGARTWWPCKDVPSDKADSVDVRVTVPTGLLVASNGTLAGVVNNGPTTTFRWQERYPIATYLVSVAIHPYVIFSHWYHYSPTDSMEVQNYVFPSHYEPVQENYALTVPMIETFSGLFGEYPFIDEKYGHAEFTRPGGMEHQTITSLWGWNEDLISHELAHQWWGDYITCQDFHHIWLNEGFATYCQALWREARYGEAEYHAEMAENKYLGDGTVYVPDVSDVARIFSGDLSYRKAAWVLHMLRHVVGDATFFSILQTYYNDPNRRYGTATTEQLHGICEAVTGMDLDWFFHQWIYEEYYPQYSPRWTAARNGENWEISLTIDQLQTNYTYKMLIDVEIQSAAGDTTTVVVWDSLASQDFLIDVPFAPNVVLIDPDDWILGTVYDPVVDPTFDRGILVVNGVDIDRFRSAIWPTYADSTFWGSHPITFWDCFLETAWGYPSNVPEPIGHGSIPSNILGQYSSVVWVGNNWGGDLERWSDTSILSYLEAGGNVLLITRMADLFLEDSLSTYLGVTWREAPEDTIESCVSTYSGLTDMSIISIQNYCSVFDTSLASGESTLLFKDTVGFATERGVGAWRKPAGGAGSRPDGGQFVFISGRPYRYDHGDLRGNVDYILTNFFGEPYDPATDANASPAGPAFALGQNIPNPFNPRTRIRFSIPRPLHVTMRVYDVAGRLVTTLADRNYPAGSHSVEWDGKDRRGVSAASGVYFYKIVAGADVATRKMVLLR